MYDILGVQLKETGESFYNPMIPGVIEELQSLGMIKDENGIYIYRICLCIVIMYNGIHFFYEPEMYM